MSDAAPRFEVLLTSGAESDLEGIYDHIAAFDSPAQAQRLLDQLMTVVQGLAIFPTRGSYPKELLALGIKEYRQTSFKPFRVIYRISTDKVIIHLIADGRRFMPALLARRLLGA